MKILYVTHHWTTNSHHSQYSGYQRIVPFMARKHDVTVLTWGEENKAFQEKNYKVLIQKTPNDPFRRRLSLSKYAKEIAGRYDVIHALYTDCGYHLPASKNFIATLHVSPSVAKYKGFVEKVFLNLKARFLEQKVFKNAHKIICISKNLLPEIQQQHPEKALFMPHGIDTEFWNDSIKNKELRQQLLGKKFKAIALCVGSHGIQKEVLENCIYALKDVLFVMVGVDLGKFYDNLLFQKGISDEALRDLYQVADVFFRPMDFATANNSLLEAMAVGNKIVVSDIEGVTDYIGEEECFFVKNDSDFPATLEEVLNNPLAAEKAIKAKVLAQQQYAWTVIAERLESLYKSAINHR